jgi:hypothetical protein
MSRTSSAWLCSARSGSWRRTSARRARRAASFPALPGSESCTPTLSCRMAILPSRTPAHQGVKMSFHIAGNARAAPLARSHARPLALAAGRARPAIGPRHRRPLHTHGLPRAAGACAVGEPGLYRRPWLLGPGLLQVGNHGQVLNRVAVIPHAGGRAHDPMVTAVRARPTRRPQRRPQRPRYPPLGWSIPRTAAR